METRNWPINFPTCCRNLGSQGITKASTIWCFSFTTTKHGRSDHVPWNHYSTCPWFCSNYWCSSWSYYLLIFADHWRNSACISIGSMTCNFCDWTCPIDFRYSSGLIFPNCWRATQYCLRCHSYWKTGDYYYYKFE